MRNKETTLYLSRIGQAARKIAFYEQIYEQITSLNLLFLIPRALCIL